MRLFAASCCYKDLNFMELFILTRLILCRTYQGTQISSGSKYSMSLEEDGRINFFVKLEIMSVSSKDEGEYKIIASNDVGRGEATVNLRFEGETATDKPK